MDENVPNPIAVALQGIFSGLHDIKHVNDLGWKETKDAPLIRRAAARGYEAIVTADERQLMNSRERAALRDTGIHHIRFQQRGRGLTHLACMVATGVAGMPDLLTELKAADRQRFALLRTIRPSRDLYAVEDRLPRIRHPR